MTKYVVVQMYTDVEGTVAHPTNVYDNEADAWARYYGVLAVAVKSNYPVHSCMLMTDDAVKIESKAYYHEASSAPVSNGEGGE